MIRLLIVSFFFLAFKGRSQSFNWSSFVDSIPTLSSPRPVDLNGDNVLDIVFGGGTDGQASLHGVMAFSGVDGSLIWEVPSRNEVFGSAVFIDITNDGVKDVFINGREAQLMAINGSTGELLWDFFPYGTNPADSGYFNFYNPFILDDYSGDGIPDLLVANGGDHSAPEWETNRPPGHLLIINSSTGSIISKAVVPDSAETYCSPVVVDLQGNGSKWVLFGTGGENIGGSFWVSPLADLLNNTLQNSTSLRTSSEKGFIAPASVFQEDDGSYDIYVQGYDGEVGRFDGLSFSELWSFSLSNTESSAAPVIGNFFGGDVVPDVYLSLFKGVAPSYTDFYQVMLDGLNGTVHFLDSVGVFGYASGTAVDLNNDGRDEVLVSLTENSSGYYQTQVKSINFQNNSIQDITDLITGVNLGSTPLIYDSNQDSILEVAFTVKKDSINPVGWKGVYLKKYSLEVNMPNSGLAWGGYMGVNYNGYYNYSPLNCGVGSLILGANYANPSCNNLEDGYVLPIVDTNNHYTYLWSNSSLDSSIENLGAGVYWVHITDNQGCYEERSISLIDPYVVSFGGLSSPTCIGDSNGVANVSSTGCPCQFSTCTFLWDNGITTKPNNSLTSGWHYVTINHPDGCITYDSVLVPSPLPVVIDTTIQNPLCSGYSDGSIILETDSLFSPHVFSWNTGDTLAIIDSLSAGLYSCVVNDSRGCVDSLFVDVLEPETVDFNSVVDHPSCVGYNDGSIFFSNITGGNGEYTCLLNDSIVENPATNISDGFFYLQVLDSSGCPSSILYDSLISPSSVSFLFDPSPESSAGAGDGSILLTLNGGTPPYYILWDDANLQTSETAENLSSGWYTAQVTDSNGCVYLDSTFLGVSVLQELLDVVSVFPNPSKGLFYLNQKVDKASVFSLSGKKLYQANNVSTISLEEYEKGFYFLIASLNNRKYRVLLIKD
jgi:hypothetical protein